MLGINLSVMQLHRMPARPVPSAFAPQDWSLTDAATGGALVVRTLRLPDDGGAGLTTLEISLDGGEWRVLNAASLGVFLVTGLTDHVETSVRLRAVSDVGAGAASEPARATPTPLPVAPGMIAAPEISGAAVVGATLIASGGLWAGEPAPALAWVWRRDGVSIKGAEGAEYRVAPEDEDRDIDVLVTATNRVGAASALAAVTRIAARFPITTKEIPPQAAALGDWWGLDLSEYASADTSLSFALTEGALPAEVLFDDQAGMVHGAPTESGVRALTFEARTATGARSIPVSLRVRREMSNVTTGGAYLTRPSVLGLTEGPGLRRKMTFAARFTIPADLSSAATLFDVTGRHSFRVFSTGKISISLYPPEIGPAVASWTSSGGVNDGLEHTFVVTADLNDAAPTMDVTLDGVAMPGSFSTAPVASELAVNRNGYAVGERVSLGNVLPLNAALRWVYVSFDDAIPGADFEGAADPASLGSPSLFFGGMAADWNAGTNFGAVGGAFTVTNTFAAIGAEAVLDPTPRAVPGALGYGRFATGGRGAIAQDVHRVTSTADDVLTPGTLPYALAQAPSTPGAPIYIIIEAEGACELADTVELTNPNTTIDARRAPGLGFWLVGAGLRTRASNVVHLGLRSFPGSNFDGLDPTARDAFRLDGETSLSDIYYYKCDAGFGLDEVWSIWPDKKTGVTVSDVTLHDCVIFESCHESLHISDTPSGVDGDGNNIYKVDNHGKALLFGPPTSNITFFGGAIISHADRTPRVQGHSTEIINATIANFNLTAAQVTVGATANFINTAWMKGPKDPSGKTTHAAKWIQGNPVDDTREMVYETGEFSGSWTLAGGFDDTAILPNWRTNAGTTAFMQDSAMQNDALFIRSGADAFAQTAQEAFLSVNDRLGARNSAGERHPFTERVIRYVTEDVPFSTGWNGPLDGGLARMPKDEVRAIGASVAGGAGSLTVTLPVANVALPPVSGRPWTAVEVSAIDYWAGPVVADQLIPAKTGRDWSDAAPVSGALSGGVVTVSNLTPGWYTIRVVYYAGALRVPLYTGRPVEVT